MTTLLAVDTSTSINTLALCRRAKTPANLSETLLLAETVAECRRRHSERLLGAVEWILEEAGVAFDAVDALAVSVGPGSFTGLRIGVAAWKGLAFARNLPLVAVPTLDAMSHVFPVRDGIVCPLLDARMKEVFAAAYRFRQGQRETVLRERACSIESFLDCLHVFALQEDTPIHFLGDGARLYREHIERRLPGAWFAPGPLSVPRASAVAEEAFLRLEAGVSTDPALAAPIYLRQSQAETSRAQKASGV